MSGPHADGGGCYVNGRTEVAQGVAPKCDEPGCSKTIDDYWEPHTFALGASGERAVDVRDLGKCKYCRFALNHDEGWGDRVCDECRAQEEQDRSDRDEHDGYDPDEDRTP